MVVQGVAYACNSVHGIDQRAYGSCSDSRVTTIEIRRVLTMCKVLCGQSLNRTPTSSDLCV